MSDQNYECHCNAIKGIKCNVDNCYYHKSECECTAGEVNVGSVGPRCADCSSETLCATFKPRETN